jgi:conserved domain protein
MYKKSNKLEFRGIIMKFNYNGLWKVLIDKNMKKKDLIDRTGISPTTISKMVRGEAVSLSVIWKICEELGTDVGDLICIDKNAEEDK